MGISQMKQPEDQWSLENKFSFISDHGNENYECRVTILLFWQKFRSLESLGLGVEQWKLFCWEWRWPLPRQKTIWHCSTVKLNKHTPCKPAIPLLEHTQRISCAGGLCKSVTAVSFIITNKETPGKTNLETTHIHGEESGYINCDIFIQQNTVH